LEAWCLVMAAVRVVWEGPVSGFRTISDTSRGCSERIASYLAVIDVTNGTYKVVSDV
jgi:hypothetical protein